MPSVIVTLIYALSVRTEALAGQMQTHIEALPTLQALRLCHRFGQGRFKDFPLELVKMIEGYVIEPVREKVAKDLEVASRCFKDECSILDRASRADLLWFYNKWVDETNTRHQEYFHDPTDAELMECLETGVGYDPPDLQDLDEETAVDICRQPSTKELAKFTQALRFLKLKVFVHNSQKLSPALKLGSSEEIEETAESDPSNVCEDSNEPTTSDVFNESDESHSSKQAGDLTDKDEKLVLFPRLMLLSRHKEESRFS
ncbi:hypothetical protein MBLNU13_g11690t2 [Cladosporium sp. NU13]